jgi:integrase
VGTGIRGRASLRREHVEDRHREPSGLSFANYAREWIDNYAGRTRKGIREETRVDYRKRLEQDAIPFFGRIRLSAIEARDLDALAKHVAGRGVKANTVRLSLAPVKALLADAHARGDLRSNPVAGYRTRYELDAVDTKDRDAVTEDVRALAPAELAAFLDALEADEAWARWRPFFEFLVQTGLRIGEAIEFRWKDVDLGQRTARVSRRFYRGRVGPTKSKYGRRPVKLPPAVAQPLWQRWADEQPDSDVLVFTSERGERIDQSNLMSRVLKPAAVNAGLGEWVKTPRGRRAESWVGFHTFRHTCATELFRYGWNAMQVQKFLGHHRGSFTLDTYVHLLPEDLPEPPTMAPRVGNERATQAAETSRDEAPLAEVV